MRLVTAVLLSAALFAARAAPAGSPPASPATQQVSERLASGLKAHPRLFWPAEGPEELRKRIESSADLQALRTALLAKADQCKTLPALERTMTGRRLLSVSREYFQRISVLAMAWHLTGDDSYRLRAQAEMLTAAAFSDWNPSHFLDVAEMTAALGVGYDWLHTSLDPATRATIRQAIVEKGLKPSLTGRHSWVDISNNWNQVCHGGLAIGALAIADDEPDIAAKIIGRAVEKIPIGMAAYAPDGAYPEGPTYWIYGTSYNVLLIAALESALGSDFGIARQPGFLASGTYMLHVTGPTGQYHNYSDSGGENRADAVKYWLASRCEDPSLLWFDNQNLTASLRSKSVKGRAEDRFFPFILLWAPSTLTSTRPASLDWSGQGPNPVAFFRSGWDRDDRYVGIKGGSPSVNHGHMDVGSFVFDALGTRWVGELGAEGYTKLEKMGVDLWNKKQDSQRWSILRIAPQGHSVLLLNGQRQLVRGKATLSATGLGSASPTATLKTSSLYQNAGEVVRKFTFHNRHSLIVEDRLGPVQAGGTARWQIMTRAQVQISGADAVLTRNGQTLRMRITTPTGAAWIVEDLSKPGNALDSPNPDTRRVAFDVRIPPGGQTSLRVELLPEEKP